MITRESWEGTSVESCNDSMFQNLERGTFIERPILFINACVRKESRTRKLAEKLLIKLNKPYEEVRLEDISFPVVNEIFLNIRNQFISDGDFHSLIFDHARRFAQAETIVIAAPYWDLSFPSALKQYLEQISVVGITFRYSEDGVPIGLCRAKRLIYVTIADGYYVPEEFGYGYVKAFAQNYYGIQDVRQITAAGLDIDGANVDEIMLNAEVTIENVDLD